MVGFMALVAYGNSMKYATMQKFWKMDKGRKRGVRIGYANPCKFKN